MSAAVKRGQALAVGALCVALIAGARAAGPAITGDWHALINGEPLALSLGGDGNGTLNGAPIHWSTLGGMLVIEQQGQVFAYQFELQGNRMNVVGGDLDAPVTLERGKAPSKQAGGLAGSNKAAPKGGGGSTPAALVGKWCEAGSFSAVSGGGSSHMACFELRPDGSYSYEYEGSVSAYSSGMYGGSASQSGDSGRWSADMGAGTITAQSRSGTVSTYRLELRNHPKNRDPMICLDGTCYVTYYQKAPW